MAGLRHLFWFWFLRAILSFERCSPETGGGVCPTGNTCCPGLDDPEGDTGNGTFPSRSFCIPNDLGSYNATCCRDKKGTGCAAGYECIEDELCLAGSTITDPLVQVLPRYHLCEGIDWPLYGLSVAPNDSEVKFPYYSSHGDLSELYQSDHWSEIRIVLIVIHGAGRNADDYICSASAAVRRQTVLSPRQVLLLSPRFSELQDDDAVLAMVGGGAAVRWDSGADPDGVWRYGAAAAAPPAVAGNLSTFAALDGLLEALRVTRLPSLRRIVVAGHSSGGQFLQRWALLTGAWNASLVLGAVANPSSFAYLTARRRVGDAWRVPSAAAVAACPDYDRWGHGLSVAGAGGAGASAYVRAAVAALGAAGVRRRFARRQMLYLAGSLDVCNVTGHGARGWCDSHGLEAACADALQGTTRLERQRYYLESLRLLAIPYQRVIVQGVGHDHSLLFNSREFREAVFDLSVVGGGAAITS